MNERPRLCTSVLQDHLERHRQMAFVSGPRQVGKTTVCRSLSNSYLNWDNSDDRRSVLRGPASLAESPQLNRLRGKPPVAVLDELHKYSKWKALLKGFFDTQGDRVRLIVTGSSRLDIFRRGGDNLMGRYLLYRMHPWSLGEGARTDVPAHEIQLPGEIRTADWEALWDDGGFLEPFRRQDIRFSHRWPSLRLKKALTLRAMRLNYLTVGGSGEFGRFSTRGVAGTKNGKTDSRWRKVRDNSVEHRPNRVVRSGSRAA